MTRSIFLIALVLAIGMMAASVNAQECLPLGVNCWNDITGCCSGYCQNSAHGASFCRERSPQVVEPKCLDNNHLCFDPLGSECCSGYCKPLAGGISQCRTRSAL